jgi:hypothetical protein
MNRFAAACLCLALSALLLTPSQACARGLSPEAETAVAQAGGPFTADEFDRFLTDLSSIPELSARGMDTVEDGPDATLPDEILTELNELGWNENRFFYIYSHAISVLSLDQMNRALEMMQAEMASMPAKQRQMMEQMINTQQGDPMSAQLQAVRDEVDSEVPASEQSLITANADRLRKALGIPAEQ